MDSLSGEIQELISKIAEKNNLKNYSVELNKTVSNAGDGYVGVINGLILRDKDSDKQLNLVVKTAPTNENLRRQFPTRTCFVREIQMYDKVLPDLLKFQEEYNLENPFTSVAKFYGYIDDEFKETLVLENIKNAGFKLCKRQEPLDSNHLSLVIIEYAKLHALSHAMKKLQPDRFKNIEERVGRDLTKDFNPENIDKKKGEKTSADKPPVDMVGMFFDPTLEALKDRPELLEPLNRFKGNIFKKIFTPHHEKDAYKVVSHGDCWSANMLFKYEDLDKPDIPNKLCLIDWQMSSLYSPIRDLSYFFFISAGKKDLENYMNYLQLYHSTLSETLSGFGLDSEDIYPFEVFMQQWKKDLLEGFFMLFIMLEQTLSEGKTHDFEALAKDGNSIFENFKRGGPSELFKQRMGDVVEFLVDNNFM